MSKPKKRAATVHFDPDLWDRVERLAQEERRPVSQLLRNLISDAVAGRSSRGTPTGIAA
jgi:predicted transcriptional regulator